MNTEQAMRHRSQDGLVWFKSSYSGSNGGNCVEVAACPEVIHVRDSKDVTRPHLRFPSEEWSAFLELATAHR